MNSFEGRAKRYHVHPRIPFPDNTALKSGMNRLHLNFLAEEGSVRRFCKLEDRRIEVGLPSRISVRAPDLCPRQLKNRADGFDSLVQLGHDGAPLARCNFDHVLLRTD